VLYIDVLREAGRLSRMKQPTSRVSTPASSSSADTRRCPREGSGRCRSLFPTHERKRILVKNNRIVRYLTTAGTEEENGSWSDRFLVVLVDGPAERRQWHRLISSFTRRSGWRCGDFNFFFACCNLICREMPMLHRQATLLPGDKTDFVAKHTSFLLSLESRIQSILYMSQWNVAACKSYCEEFYRDICRLFRSFGGSSPSIGCFQPRIFAAALEIWFLLVKSQISNAIFNTTCQLSPKLLC